MSHRVAIDIDGGWGDPLERDPAQALSDLRAGYVSRETSRDIYGVILSEDKVEFDADSTAALRASLRAKRGL